MRISKDRSDRQLNDEVKVKNREYYEGDWALQLLKQHRRNNM